MSHHKGPRSRVTLRLPGALAARIKAAARKEGLDLNTFITQKIAEEADKA